jgi:hypothetical protein
MSKNRFEGEVRKAWDKVKDEIRTRRTVSINTLAALCERENDPRWMQRIQNVFPDFVEALDDAGVPAVAVNSWCVRHYSEVVVDDLDVGLKCIQLRGGGAPAAGIRRAEAGDRVLEAHIKSLSDLNAGGVTAAIQTAKEAEMLGIVSTSGSRTLINKVQERIHNAAALPAAPMQAPLRLITNEPPGLGRPVVGREDVNG